MIYNEEDLLPISALQHFLFCERQAALIHVEHQWKDNHLTLEGFQLHQRVDGAAQRREVREDRVIVRGLALRSLSLGLVGRADVVEFHRVASATPGWETGEAVGADLPGIDGKWRPFPVEYKRGKPKREPYDEVQLCAQALCLEEQFSVVVLEGALFYGERQRRSPVAFDDRLRSLTTEVARGFRSMMQSCETPRATRMPKCERCSLLEVCIPDAMSSRSAGDYLRAALDNFSGDSKQGPA